MAWRAAHEDDMGWIGTLLLKHIASSMFLLGNLRAHGLRSDHPHGMNLWVQDDASGVFGIANSGSVMMQMPTATQQHWREAAALLRLRPIMAVLGDTHQVRPFLAASGLERADTQLNRDDPSFVLDLENLIFDPRAEEKLVGLPQVSRSLLVDWRAQYQIEVIGEDPATAQDTARGQIAEFIEKDSHRVLLSAGKPVAMTGYNMEVPEAVQLGGVFTPPAARGKGYARRAVALHLLESRAKGVPQAILFAASHAAAAAYRAVGFQPAGAYALVMSNPGAPLRIPQACTSLVEE